MGRNWYPGAPWSPQSAYMAEAADRVGQAGRQAMEYPGQFASGAQSMWDNYQDMQADNTKNGADKYFHCKANCEATRQGTGGRHAAVGLSALREEVWGRAKGDSASDRAADYQANRYGRDHAHNQQSCKQVCAPYRVNGINKKY
uniref:Serum amyloid A protein n=1 Tax=Magnetococcus massalia (strain MO-1) TaxID=451514 RepID=A0A1S7LE26_MAGMO|nr:Serum amyloid A protein [Candidatus Magnetococcus massalia]